MPDCNLIKPKHEDAHLVDVISKTASHFDIFLYFHDTLDGLKAQKGRGVFMEVGSGSMCSQGWRRSF